ncbi:LPS translocon maturation chaperone LptM [Comamonas badia]|uniref:LPS translocon maturation chaperone LptM n=1 Tax=Comamonas badia TaxID=265291 RepID=UPI000421BB86|nr:lipoprotein [Comamonas badia]
MTKAFLPAMALAASTLLLSACGQRGPLRLPAPPAAPPAAATPATPDHATDGKKAATPATAQP